MCKTPVANPVIYRCKRCGDSVRQGADNARPNSSGKGETRMELMMSHLHDGPAVAARDADAAEVTFLVRGSSQPPLAEAG